MNVGRVHPEVTDMLYAMKAGHLPASQEDIRKLEDSFVSSQSNDCAGQHPEYVDYCHYARSQGYTCKC